MATTATVTSRRFKSRAVLRVIEAGSFAECAYCGKPVKFQAKTRQLQVICNVYVKGRWDRVEHYHERCYHEADDPYGTPLAAA
ncbi:hypothetical protein [Rhabdothermincola sp.]|uniref:hypothetical protein n=1 Tax=Rhabdothermincola sp. TaxID=2820405 RepID=UPI002FE0F7DB